MVAMAAVVATAAVHHGSRRRRRRRRPGRRLPRRARPLRCCRSRCLRRRRASPALGANRRRSAFKRRWGGMVVVHNVCASVLKARWCSGEPSQRRSRLARPFWSIPATVPTRDPTANCHQSRRRGIGGCRKPPGTDEAGSAAAHECARSHIAGSLPQRWRSKHQSTESPIFSNDLYTAAAGTTPAVR